MNNGLHLEEYTWLPCCVRQLNFQECPQIFGYAFQYDRHQNLDILDEHQRDHISSL